MKKKEYKKPKLTVLKLSDDIVLASDSCSGVCNGYCSKCQEGGNSN